MGKLIGPLDPIRLIGRICRCTPGATGKSGYVFEFTTATVIYCMLVAAVYLGLWFYYDRRDRRRFEAARRKHAVHCVRCNHVYAAPYGMEVSPCPRCGHSNMRLRF